MSFKRCRHFIPLSVVLAGLFFLFGCDQNLTDQQTLAQKAADGAKEIRFAMQNRIGSAIPLIAVKNGYFTAAGLRVKALRFNNGPACAEALYSGSADIGTMGDTTAIISLTRSDQLLLLTSHGTGEHRHRLIVPGNSPYKTLADLKGKRIAIKKGTSTFGGFLVALSEQNLQPQDFDVIDLSPGTMPDALASGSVAAIAASEPTPSLAELKGGRELTTFGGLGNQYPVMMLARKGFLAERDKDVVSFMQALVKAERFIAAHPQEAAAILAKTTGLPDVVALRAMKKHSYRLRLDQQITDSLNFTADFLQQQKYIGEPPDFSAVTESRYLEAANQQAINAE